MLLAPRPDAPEDDRIAPVDEVARAAAVELPAALAQLATLARAERIPFEPAPGMLAARLQRFQRPSKESHRCSAAECQTHR
jgi:hypothetical protein